MQLLCLLGWHVGFPVAQDGVEDAQELSGDGNVGELCRFAGLSQLCVEGLEAIGAADGVERVQTQGPTGTSRRPSERRYANRPTASLDCPVQSISIGATIFLAQSQTA